VITRDPLTDYLPIQRKPEAGGKLEDAPIVTQYEMHGVEDLGLLKMDFLGLRNLDVLEIALDLIAETTGARPDIDRVPLDDVPTFELLRRGDTVGVFQLEGGPMRALLRSLAPTDFEDVAALIALYRPGPMAQNWHNEYADRKNGRTPVVYPHDDLQEVLEPTYGLMIYQEQLMRVAQRLAGYSLEEADNLRKATGKKIREVIAKERTRFVQGCVENGHTEAFGNDFFDMIEPFADYSFNKSHSFGYGFVTYQTAWLKANHPSEYLAALLTSVKTNKDQTAVFLNECRQMGIEVLVPDVNESVSDFSVRTNPEGDADAKVASKDANSKGSGDIRFGLSAVRNVGEGVVAHIVAAREEGGPFTDFYDFCDRVDPTVLNKRTVESLAKAGAFDSLGHPRQGLVFVHETIIETVLARRRNEAEGQFDLFSAVDDPAPEAVVGQRTPIPDTEFAKSQRLAFEKEMLGLYVSDHPMMGAERALKKYVECTLAELRVGREGEMRTVGGIVTTLNRKYTKRGDLMATFVLEDLAAALEVMVFPKTMQQYGHLLEDDAIVVVKGRLDARDDMPKIIAMEITRPELSVDSGPPVRVKVKLHTLSDTKVGKLKTILSEHPGDSPVYVHLESPEKTTVLRLGDEHLVDAGTGLYAELRILLGADCIT
jgi:DNA polymerase-3 subunit alpha